MNDRGYLIYCGFCCRRAFSAEPIYDFITLPTPIERVNYSSESSKMERSLIVKEINRMLEFGQISLNPSESDRLIKELSEAYGMDLLKESEACYE